MYLTFDKETKQVAYIGEKKPVVYTSNLDAAEYKGEIPKNDYLTVTNLREETETWIEKKIVTKTIIEKEPQTIKKTVWGTVEIKDENGEVVIDEEGNILKTFKPKIVEETIEVDVEKEVEEEITETKSRTYLACDLVANFYPPKTEEELALVKQKKYEILCEKYIREKYSASDEFKILRRYQKNPYDASNIENFNTYNEYVESCLAKAEAELNK